MGDVVAEFKTNLITTDADVNRFNISIQPSITVGTAKPLHASDNHEDDKDNTTLALVGMLFDLSQSAQHKFDELKDIVSERLGNGLASTAARLAYSYVESWISSIMASADEFHGKPSTAKQIAWHPHRNMLAIAYQDNTIHVFERDEHGGEWKPKSLQHRFMKDITSLEWKKRARGTLAVGCRNGVCIWNLGSDTTNANLTSNLEPRHRNGASMNYLCYPGHGPVSALAWDPTPASHLLAVASATNGTLVIYDTMTLTSTPLKRKGRGNILLRWSPDGTWLFVASRLGSSRMWDTRHWAHRDFTNPPGLWVQSACWAPDSRNLFISMHGKSDIHLVYWASTAVAADFRQEKVYSVKAPVEGPTNHATGNHIREVALSPLDGKRLAVIFENSDCVGLYEVQLESTPSLGKNGILQHIGIVNTQASLNRSGKPIHIAYSSHSSSSSTLAVLHETGIVDFITQVA